MEDVAPGWITLSMSITGISLFLTFSIFVLSIALQHVINNFSKEKLTNDIFYEIESLDVYLNAKNELNIEIDQTNDKK